MNLDDKNLKWRRFFVKIVLLWALLAVFAAAQATGITKSLADMASGLKSWTAVRSLPVRLALVSESRSAREFFLSGAEPLARRFAADLGGAVDLSLYAFGTQESLFSAALARLSDGYLSFMHGFGIRANDSARRSLASIKFVIGASANFLNAFSDAAFQLPEAGFGLASRAAIFAVNGSTAVLDVYADAFIDLSSRPTNLAFEVYDRGKAVAGWTRDTLVQDVGLLDKLARNDFDESSTFPLHKQKPSSQTAKMTFGGFGDSPSRVLGEFVSGIDSNLINQLVDSRLNEYLNAGKLKGEKGDTGPVGPAGSSGPAGPTAGMYVVAPSDKSLQGTTGSFAYLSSGVTELKTLTVTNNITTEGLSATSGGITSLTFSNATSSGALSIAGDLTVSGITGSTQCLQADTNGVVTGTGLQCGSGTGGGSAWQELWANTLTPTNTSAGIFVNASSTFNSNLNVTGRLSVATSTPYENYGAAIATSTIILTDTPEKTKFYVGSSTAASLVVANNGNVGIGTASPGSYSLYVNGAIYSVGTLTLAGGSAVSWGTSNAYIQGGGTGSAGYISFRAGGSTRMEINGIGNVGIGTSTPSSTLTVQGSGAVNPFTVASSTGSSLLTVLPNGNVGIGTSAPGAALDVRSAISLFGSTQGLTYISNDTLNFGYNVAGEYTGVINYSSNGGNQNFRNLKINNGRGSTVAIFNGSTGYVGIGTTTPWAKLSVNAFNATPSDAPLFVIASSTGTSATSTYFTVSSTGNVGIGTASPSYTLDVNGSIRALNTISASNGLSAGGSPGYNGILTLYNSSSVTKVQIHSAGSSYFNSGNVGIGTTTPWAKLSVQNYNGGYTPLFTIASSTGVGATSTAFIVDSVGNVGIGTTSPVALLSLGNGNGAAGTTASLGINFGDATANLYRSGAGTLTTDGSLAVGANTLISSGSIIAPVTNTSFSVSGKLQTTNGAAVALRDGGATMTVTSGTNRIVVIGNNSILTNPDVFGPISGNAILNALELNYSINQTGTASGITRGLYVNPTLTSAYDFRGIETAAYLPPPATPHSSTTSSLTNPPMLHQLPELP